MFASWMAFETHFPCLVAAATSLLLVYNERDTPPRMVFKEREDVCVDW
jgi:hypothetical protein